MKIGSLFSGTGGLDMGVQSVLGGEVAWHCDNDPGASRILAHHWPDVPNLGDITKVDWATVEPVDVITGGFPCQDVSHAGKRAGLGSSTRTGLWSHMALAIETLRPSLVVAENVRGLLSARADSDMEPCPWCLGDGEDEPPMRALGAVLADLADIGYDARWCGIRAADVGAPHGRFRVFVVATDANDRADDRQRPRAEPRLGVALATHAADDGHERDGRARDGRPGPTDSGQSARHADVARLEGWERAGRPDERTPRPAGLEPAPDSSSERHGRGQDARGVGRVDGGAEGEAWQRERARAESGDRGDAATADADECGLRPVVTDLRAWQSHVAWGDYEPAIRQWERVLGRLAPAPTEPGRTGLRLSPRFVEWLMGLPEGHVCDVPGLTRNAQLKALGNGVVPAQAAAALRILLALEAAA